MTLTKIQGGTLYDPAHGIDGQVRDVWIENGRVVAAPIDPSVRPQRVIDAAGLVVMPGGIDMHCHIAGPKVNLARRLRTAEKRRAEPVLRTPRTHSGTLGSVPSTFATGYKYAGLGYTTAFDAAIPPIAARHAHAELADTPCIDKGFFVLVGNNHYLLQAMQDREPGRLTAFTAWLLQAAKGYAAKIVNPGGIEAWKCGHLVRGLDEQVPSFRVTPRQILRQLAATVDSLGFPHPVHIHANNLGLPGNWATTLETMRALDGHRGHLTHVQFHSYGGGDEDETTFCSQVQPLADYVNEHPNLTVDVGQVLFGKTTSMTGDSQVGYYLSRVYQTQWASSDTELESGCGVAPIEYKQKSLVHAWQWAIGLEWYLLVKDPWRIAMSTDHPNGGSFLAYPQIIRLLMDRDYRRDTLKQVHPVVAEGSLLRDLDREYTLYEICILTRAAPARMLGLRDKGHLGPGADADVTIYSPDPNAETMFSLPRIVIKSGRVIVEQGELREPCEGRTLHITPDYDREREAHVAEWFERHYSLRFRNYPVGSAEMAEAVEIPCTPV